MLEQYKDSEAVFYKIVTRAVKTNKLSHAYLFEMSGENYDEHLIMSFVKYVLCPSCQENSDTCSHCTLCKRIDDGNYPELKIIRPDGLWIKKDQLLELQKEFGTKVIEGNLRIYIIYECEKLNKHAANSILKFLEEPEEGIMAILVTKNINLVLKTILSRCQILSLSGQVNRDVPVITSEFIKNILSFIEYYENYHLQALVMSTEIWHSKVDGKEKFADALDVCVKFYDEVLKFKTFGDIINFKEYKDVIKKISDINTDLSIIKKIEIFAKNKELVKYNVNNNLLYDKIVIELGGK